MIMRFFSIYGCFLLLIAGVHLSAQPKFVPVPVLQDKDSLIIHVDEYPLKIYRHQVLPGQTLYSIARFFGLTVAQLRNFNPDLPEEGLEVNSYLNIPIPSRVIKRYKDSVFIEQAHIPIYYRVEKGENLFRISKAYFKMPVDTMARRNGLDSLTIVPGQLLHIGWMERNGIPDSLQYRNPMVMKNFTNRLNFTASCPDKIEFTEQGAALWQDSEIDNDEFLALSNKVPVNSVIAVRNPMTKRTAYARVIGKKPPLFDDAVVIVSEATALFLGAIDARFFVQIAYPCVEN